MVRGRGRLSCSSALITQLNRLRASMGRAIPAIAAILAPRVPEELTTVPQATLWPEAEGRRRDLTGGHAHPDHLVLYIFHPGLDGLAATSRTRSSHRNSPRPWCSGCPAAGGSTM